MLICVVMHPLGRHPVQRGRGQASARNRVIQIESGQPVQMAGVTVHEGDYVSADRCGTVLVPADRVEEVLDLAERIA